MAAALGTPGTLDDAIASLRHAAARNPRRPQIWRQLADHLDLAGDRAGAEAAYLDHVTHAIHDPALMAAGAALHANDVPEAEARLRQQLKQAPTDVVAIRMLAEVAARLGRGEDAAHLLERCLELAPGFHEARHNYAIVLNRANRPEEAIVQLEHLLRADPVNPGYRNLKAVALCHTGGYEAAIAIYDELIGEYPDHAQTWLSLGHALKTAGRTEG
jgi:predicted Zn-dependent protease